MKRGLVYGVVAGAIFFACVYLFSSLALQRDSSMRTVRVGGKVVRVTVAQTPEERQKGLGDREGLAPDEGMLFIFPTDGKYGFWMKDMLFSIDIVWLSADGRIVYVAPHISPETYPRGFVPTSPARYVLELPAGYMALYGVAVGDMVEL